MANTTMKVAEIKEKLSGLGVEAKDIKGKKKAELLQMLNGLEDGVPSLDNKPSVTSPAWSPFVMSLFEEDELVEGAPRCDGLRRVAELLVGRIVSSETDVRQCPSLDNAMRATVVVNLLFDNDIFVSGAADVYSGNSARPFSSHPVATAETRAEARALRRILRLVKVQSAEELEGPSVDEPSEYGKINEGLRGGIMQICDQLGIDMEKFSQLQYDKPFKEVEEEEGRNLVEQLKKYRQNTEEIPDTIRKG
jgi:hypothetical protein